MGDSGLQHDTNSKDVPLTVQRLEMGQGDNLETPLLCALTPPPDPVVSIFSDVCIADYDVYRCVEGLINQVVNDEWIAIAEESISSSITKISSDISSHRAVKNDLPIRVKRRSSRTLLFDNIRTDEILPSGPLYDNSVCTVTRTARSSIDEVTPLFYDNNDLTKCPPPKKVKSEEEVKCSPPFVIPQSFLSIDKTSHRGMVALIIPLKQLQEHNMHSRIVTTRGVGWSLFARIVGTDPQKPQNLSIFLKCEIEDDDFSIDVFARIMLHHWIDSNKDIKKEIRHTYVAHESDWGFTSFYTLEKISDYLKDGMLRISCEYDVEEPRGSRFGSEPNRIPCGIKNQGLTCYINSVIQLVFFTKALRKAVYQLECNLEDGKSVIRAMQKLFYHLQTRPSPGLTCELTNSFGWNQQDLQQQHDVQELCRVLLDKMENKMKGTHVESLIRDLFQTKTMTYIRCLHVDYVSTKEETCLDIQLPLRRSSHDIFGRFTLKDSFNEWTKKEILDGDNKYSAGIHGLQIAEKGIKILYLPKVLHLHLMRFQYDPYTNGYVKLNDEFIFDEEVNLSEFVEHSQPLQYEYALHGVLAHSGNAGGGHYIAFVNTRCGEKNSKWYKLDDSKVTLSSPMEAIHKNYGTRQNNDDSPFNAYMLVYIRKDSLNEVLCEVTENDIPSSLKQRFHPNNQSMNIVPNKKKRDISGLQIGIQVIRQPNFGSHILYDIYDKRKLNDINDSNTILRVYENEPGYQLIPAIQALLGHNSFRIWSTKVVDTKISQVRIHKPIRRHSIALQLMNMNDTVKTLMGGNAIIYVQERKSITILKCVSMKKRKEGKKVVKGKEVFVKYYNGLHKCLSFIGQFRIYPNDSFVSICHTLSNIINLPSNTDYRWYKERSPEDILPLRNRDKIMDGDIVIVEAIHLTNQRNNVLRYLRRCECVEVNLIPNNEHLFFSILNDYKTISMKLPLNTPLCKVMDKLGRRLSHDPLSIVLWNNNIPFKSSQMDTVISSIFPVDTVGQLDRCTPLTLKYNRLFNSLMESEDTTILQLNIVSRDQYLDCPFYYSSKDDVMNKLKSEMYNLYSFTSGERGLLRFILRAQDCVGWFLYKELKDGDDIHSIIKNLSKKKHNISVVVEEVDEEEMEPLGDNEFIIPIIQSNTRITRKFKGPMTTRFVKVKDGECIRDLKERINRKYGYEMNWNILELGVLSSSRYHSLEVGSMVQISHLYCDLDDVLPGVSRKESTKVSLVILNETIEERRRDRDKSSIYIHN